MIIESFKFARYKKDNIKFYLVSVLLVISIVGIPLVVGNYTKIIFSNMDQNININKIPNYPPYVETYFDGIMTIGFSIIPILIPGSIYFTLPRIIDTVYVGSPIMSVFLILLALFLVLSSIICLYVFPYFTSIQAYRKHNTKYSPDNKQYSIIKGFMILFLRGKYKEIIKNYIIVAIIITVVVQILSFNITAIIILGPFIFLFYLVTTSYIIGNYSNSVLEYKTSEQ